MSAVLVGSAIPLGLAGSQTAQAASRTYYVSPSGSDSNPGTSQAKPFRTLQKAADSTAPGDTVSIMNGTYREQSGRADVMVISRSGTAAAPITFRAHPGHRPVINPVSGWNGIRINGASHIAVRGLEIKGNSAGISLAQAERGASTSKSTFNTNCLSVEKNKSTGALAHHIDIVGNTVHHCPGGGIAAGDADYVTIDGNHVHSNAWYSVFANSGISILAARDVDAGNPGKYKIRITDNTVHDNESKVKWEQCDCYSDGNGIIIDTLKDKAKSGASGPDYQGRVLVANNVSYNNGGSGIHSFKSQHVDILHNTAYQNGRSTRMDSYANVYAHNSTDVKILNNVAYGRPGQSTNSKHKNTDVTYDYNVYYGGKAPEVKGPHDIVADPKIVRPGDEAAFQLRKGSPAIGSAKPLDQVTTDITGARRAADAPDRGAFAFTTDGKAPSTDDTATTPAAGAAAETNDDGSPATGTDTGGGATGEQNADPAETDRSTGSEARSDGDSGPLAATGAGVGVPLGIGAAALLLGGGIIFLIRRKRT
ncbi:right-handed parallel beta-helix repeat-containing protein [Streptomyces sp. NPDC055952]|uniref:right-handed parallel beta-helix repeat-containing protein n=1 Tax=Streptomyces sp. NPDC055952 TaxID=3345663 RepID=UPI0035E33914